MRRLWFVVAVAPCILSEECKKTRSQCRTENSLLQTISRSSYGFEMTVVEDEAKSHRDAQFLMTATFGTTAESLSELEGKTHQEWVKEQMALPVESHRAYYRQRVNPKHNDKDSEGFGIPRAPCDLNARWVQNVFSRHDIGMTVEVRDSSAIYVNGEFRTDVAQGTVSSEWTSMMNWTGTLCNCREIVGGSVFLTQGSCRWPFSMPNPSVQSASAVPTSFSFKKIHNEPDAVVVSHVFENCSLNDGDIIQQYGRNYRFDKRLALQANDVESPLDDGVACVGRNLVNEKFCKTPKNLSPPAVDGLRLEVFYATGIWRGNFVSDWVRRPAVWYRATVPNINLPSPSGNFPGWPSRYNVAAHWRGKFIVKTAGMYSFWTGSDDGSRLFIDGAMVVDNGGWHGHEEKGGSLILSSGAHGIVAEFFQGGGGLSMILQWQGPDSNDTKEVMPEGKFFSTPWGCQVTCGSPGETASEPSEGHQWPFYAVSSWHNSWRYNDGVHSTSSVPLVKSTVWTMKALYGVDQLRQRTAWALSQIFVVSASGLDTDLNEMYLSFYDIFVRNAFLNFGDILKEVALNPLMGKYLTHTGSSSYEFNGFFPNENFAREIMQLFTIGVRKLRPDGSSVRVDGEDVPAYRTEHILNFARVFTGFANQATRNNVEYYRDNLIDPMVVYPDRHDVYPKPDLDGHFLGDGLPLCDQTGSFLSKGASFEFVSVVDAVAGNVLVLPNASALYELLCLGEGAHCEFPFSIKLSEDLMCKDVECTAGAVSQVMVAGAVYQFHPPPCVHLHYNLATINDTGSVTANLTQGYCADADGSAHAGRVQLDNLDEGNTPERQEQCLEKCKGFGGTGCELIWAQASWKNGCFVHTATTEMRGSGHGYHLCWSYHAFSSALGNVGHSYDSGKVGTLCPEGTLVTSYVECRKAIASLGLALGDVWMGSNAHITPFCSHGYGRMYFNHGEGQAHGGLQPVCRAHILVDQDGDINAGGAKFSVPWADDIAASPGSHLIGAINQPVFDVVPSAADLRGRLTITTDEPHALCTFCEGEVKGYEEEGVLTVFESHGFFYRNLESRVYLIGQNTSFRNPPVFLKSSKQLNAEAAVLNEVQVLLDHLLHHNNTAVFIAKRLIQRFTSSNPSGRYVKAVAEAFRNGTFNGTVYGGNYGDLAATVAAVVLHPDARQTGVYGGALREPMLKILHLLRAMEYEDLYGSPIIFRELQDVIGEFPFDAPSVFNFFKADYELPILPESEPEPESEQPTSILAPEFEIFTPEYFAGYLNIMNAIISWGVSERCDSKPYAGIWSSLPEDGHWRRACPQGRFTWTSGAAAEAILSDLNLLLTGGRLSPTSLGTVRSAYEDAVEGQQMKSALTAMIMTPEFNTLGETLTLTALREEGTATVVQRTQPYKAAVLLWMGGGADTWNMLVPQECELYQEYVGMRTDIALTPAELLQIDVSGQNCSKFGIHHSLSFLKELYDAGEASFVTNIGGLVEPTTMQDLNRNGQRCAHLFSHNDQTRGAHTLKCQDAGTSAKGVGGRIADALLSQRIQVASFSMAGTATWSQGVSVKRESVAGVGELSSLTDYEFWRETVRNITSVQHANVYANAYTELFLDSIETYQEMSRLLKSAKLKTKYVEYAGLSRQLKQVAQVIVLQEGRQAERDLFYVDLGDFDHHSSVKTRLRQRLNEVNSALEGFVQEMRAQGVWNNVVVMSESEFARTLDSNGGGSDHAWAGNHFVIGGGLSGGKVLNRYPESVAAGNHRDLGRGRMVPEFPWESMVVPIAQWLGVDSDSLVTAFPNLHLFGNEDIISLDAMFSV
uniref:PA14 domain-containing protein n=1 Tax=Noctiluca scintillans TaxID=2966 RepID=A0A7S1F7N6_NOCSC|mmetsp:Transcript_38983/g.103605  ORF Transcript_38983/g.103605 Transcript_38983/m.103605 type:complete len:1804 (+) Transcript_38983:48-5459(+)